MAAKAIGCEPARIAKSITFVANDSCILIVTASHTKIDNQKYKAQFNSNAKMLTSEQVRASIGHAVGRVCPFALNDEVEVFLDDSLKRFETVFSACGSSNSVVELSIAELKECSNYLS